MRVRKFGQSVGGLGDARLRRVLRAMWRPKILFTCLNLLVATGGFAGGPQEAVIVAEQTQRKNAGRRLYVGCVRKGIESCKGRYLHQ